MPPRSPCARPRVQHPASRRTPQPMQSPDHAEPAGTGPAHKRDARSHPPSDSGPGPDLDTGPITNKRRRISLACNSCRVRKSRCDGRRPSCSSCISLGFDCVYEPGESAANVVVRKDYVSDVEQRLSFVEHRLQRLNDVLKGHLSPCPGLVPEPGSSNPPPGAAGVRAASLSDAPPGTHETCATGLEEPQDEDAHPNGMAMVFVEEQSSAFFGESSNINFTQLLLRAIAARHRAAPAMASAVMDGGSNVASATQSQPYQPAGPPSSSLDTAPTALPSVDEMDSLLTIYFETAGAVFPFIHEASMRDTYAECRRNGFTRARRTWLGSLNMIFAMASNFDRDSVSSARKRHERSNVFYKRANELCGDLSRRVISLEIVHYLLLTVIHCQGTQRSVQAWNCHGLVIRSAMALGLHPDSAAKAADPVQQETYRRTWLVIYILDKILSTAFGRPASIPAEEMTTRSLVALSPSSLAGAHVDIDLPGEFLRVSFELYQIMGRSLASQYGAKPVGASADGDEMGSLRASGELRMALQGWVASLPPYLRTCEPGSSILHHNSAGNRLRVILTLRYHNLAILVYKPLLSATIRHLFLGEGDGGGPPSYLVQLAMGEAHECTRAAQVTIELVHAIISADPSSSNNLGMWFYTLYYVFTASLVISSRMLWAQHGQDAADEAAVTDAKALLGKAETIFHELDHDNTLVQSCLEYIRRLDRMCSLKVTQYMAPEPRGAGGDSSLGHEHRLADEQVPLEAGTDGGAYMVPLSEEDMEAFELFTSEMFDPSIFEGFQQSPVERPVMAGVHQNFSSNDVHSHSHSHSYSNSHSSNGLW
ncbi:transcriptional regulatory protein GAL4 [Microdochium nivale]|nr:transcriptional regulatory protein GAL4 [Microdochium nivale]